jgi:intron-binding protein aquarius
MRPQVGDDDKVVWAGWSRMATPIVSFTITEVRKPNVGEVKPAAVTAELVLDTRAMRFDTKREWDELKQHDVLFLLAVQPPSDKAAAVMREGDVVVSVPERYGLQRLRGCEVVEMRDEEGNLVNDFTGALSVYLNHRLLWGSSMIGSQCQVPAAAKSLL